MLRRILADARRDLLAELRRQLGDLRVALVRAEAPEEEQKALGRAITQLDELFLLVVAGEFNAGKSAVINALLGERVLEEGVTPTTSRIELLRYGPERSRTPAGGGYEDITLPVPLLREMTVVDTPGTNAVVRGHEALTRDFVPRSDLVLFVTSADRPFTESERAFLETIRDWGKKVVVAVNKTDILDKPADVAKVIEFVREKLRELLGLQPEVFGVSARRAQKLKAAGVAPDPRTSGFGALEAYLTQTLDDAERVRLKLVAAVGVAARVLDGAAARATERLGVIEEDEAALREIEALSVSHLQDLSRDFRLRLAEVERPLAELERRGEAFLDGTLRAGRVLALADPQATADGYLVEVFGGLRAAVDKRVDGVADALTVGEVRLGPAVAERLRRRQAVHGTRMPAVAEGPPANRARTAEALRRDGHRVLEGHGTEAESRRLAGSARRAAWATLGLPVAGLAAAAAALALGESRAVAVAGVLAGVLLVAGGALAVPIALRRERRRLAAQVAGLRERLAAVFRAGFERELEASQKRVEDRVAPFAHFVRSEAERVRRQQDELASRRRDLEALRSRIDAVR